MKSCTFYYLRTIHILIHMRLIEMFTVEKGTLTANKFIFYFKRILHLDSKPSTLFISKFGSFNIMTMTMKSNSKKSILALNLKRSRQFAFFLKRTFRILSNNYIPWISKLLMLYYWTDIFFVQPMITCLPNIKLLKKSKMWQSYKVTRRLQLIKLLPCGSPITSWFKRHEFLFTFFSKKEMWLAEHRWCGIAGIDFL